MCSFFERYTEQKIYMPAKELEQCKMWRLYPNRAEVKFLHKNEERYFYLELREASLIKDFRDMMAPVFLVSGFSSFQY